ncbi:unnamed protein product [Protopolystoma xenopodis]|uniref:Uncharacterized protein n=1 Tax=Protopolystoma xenopodis TaxID=117903 RepID=A0A3S5AX40_9PLAT|nr:unnamed protein product [Protopolystoma xenopodis]
MPLEQLRQHFLGHKSNDSLVFDEDNGGDQCKEGEKDTIEGQVAESDGNQNKYKQVAGRIALEMEDWAEDEAEEEGEEESEEKEGPITCRAVEQEYKGVATANMWEVMYPEEIMAELLHNSLPTASVTTASDLTGTPLSSAADISRDPADWATADEKTWNTKYNSEAEQQLTRHDKFH